MFSQLQFFKHCFILLEKKIANDTRGEHKDENILKQNLVYMNFFYDPKEQI